MHDSLDVKARREERVMFSSCSNAPTTVRSVAIQLIAGPTPKEKGIIVM